MKKLTVIYIIVLLVWTTGCMKETPSDKIQVNTQNEKREIYAYESIKDYQQFINGENMDYSMLRISEENNIVLLQMDLVLSNNLLQKLKNTKNPFYFTFAEIPGSNKLGPLIAETPTIVNGDLDKLLTGKPNTYSIKQKVKLRESLSDREKEAIFSPELYQFAFLNEDKQAVAAILGLELSTLKAK